MANKWNLAGSYFESCNCEVACPCVFTSPPTTGECTVLIAWHIESGKYGGTSLNGLDVALAIYSPGHMLKVKWDAVLYLDDKATQAQRDALTTIFAGKAGGPPAALAPFIGKVLGVKPVHIDFQAEGKQRSLNMPGIGEMDITALEGAGGRDIMIENSLLRLSPTNPPLLPSRRSSRSMITDG